MDLLDKLLLPEVLLDDDPLPEDPELLLTDGIVTGTGGRDLARGRDGESGWRS
jgi:hypothetical protein